jgi:hypothetical protein
MDIQGKLIEIFEAQNVSETFRKREFVLEYAENPQYAELIKFELIQANCDQLDGFNVGDEIKVAFNLKGRKWTDPKGVDKYFTSLQAWRLERISGDQPTATPTSSEASKPPEWIGESFSEDDDLPF